MEVIIYQSLAIDPLDQSRKDRSCPVDGFNGTGTADRTANILLVVYTLFLLLRWHETPTIRTCRIFALMFLAILRAPLIHQVFSYERFATIGAAGSNLLAKTFRVVWHALVYVKAGIEHGFMTGSTQEVLWMPVRTQSIDVVPPDGLFAFFANWIR